jgi:hypothetical protein
MEIVHMKITFQPLALISSLIAALDSLSHDKKAMPALIPVKVITYRHCENLR